MKKLFSNQIGANLYCIRNKYGQYWDNDWGWIELENEQNESTYSVFTTAEKEVFNLPIEGYWELM